MLKRLLDAFEQAQEKPLGFWEKGPINDMSVPNKNGARPTLQP